MFEQFRNFLSGKKRPIMVHVLQADQIGDDLDIALQTYADLLDNSCRDSLIMDVARERIADLQERYHAAKLENLVREI